MDYTAAERCYQDGMNRITAAQREMQAARQEQNWCCLRIESIEREIDDLYSEPNVDEEGNSLIDVNRLEALREELYRQQAQYHRAQLDEEEAGQRLEKAKAFLRTLLPEYRNLQEYAQQKYWITRQSLQTLEKPLTGNAYAGALAQARDTARNSLKRWQEYYNICTQRIETIIRIAGDNAAPMNGH